MRELERATACARPRCPAGRQIRSDLIDARLHLLQRVNHVRAAAEGHDRFRAAAECARDCTRVTPGTMLTASSIGRETLKSICRAPSDEPWTTIVMRRERQLGIDRGWRVETPPKCPQHSTPRSPCRRIGAAPREARTVIAADSRLGGLRRRSLRARFPCVGRRSLRCGRYRLLSCGWRSPHRCEFRVRRVLLLGLVVRSFAAVGFVAVAAFAPFLSSPSPLELSGSVFIGATFALSCIA